MNALYLRHATASGSDLWQRWEWSELGSLLVAIRLTEKAPKLCFDIPIASFAHPREGAFQIARLDSERFRIMHARYVRINSIWSTRTSLFHIGLPLVPIIITHAPSDVAAQLAKF